MESATALIGILIATMATVVALFILIWKTRKDGFEKLKTTFEEKFAIMADKMSQLSGLPGMLITFAKRMELIEKRQDTCEKVMAEQQKDSRKMDKRLRYIEKIVIKPSCSEDPEIK